MRYGRTCMALIVDLRGRRFGKLTVDHFVAGGGGNNGAYWSCRCDCGEDTVVRAKDLSLGTTKSCGCARTAGASAAARARRGGCVATVVAGERYGLLTVREAAGFRHRRRVYLCDCDCGNESTVVGSLLRTGQTRSCGCLRKTAYQRRSAGGLVL